MCVAARERDVSSFRLPEFSQGSLAILKWLALVLMTLDHVDAVFYGRELGWPTQLGRLVFPIFGFVLAYNLARPEVRASGAQLRVLVRLLAFGLLAMPVHVVLFGGAWPVLNVMVTFSVFCAVVVLGERRTWASVACAVAVFVVGGAFVEYWWPGLAFCLTVYWAYRNSAAALVVRHTGDWWAVTVFSAPLAIPIATGLLWFANGTWAALWALPVIVLVSGLDARLPRLRWAFYAYYPLHLVTLVIVRQLWNL